jgi:hypothetical protein
VGLLVEKVALDTYFSESFGFPTNIIPTVSHNQSCIIWRMENGPVGSCSSTDLVSTHHNNKRSKMHKFACRDYRKTTITSATNVGLQAKNHTMNFLNIKHE